jgi:uncharacterized protein (DUF433 family)
MSKVLDDHIEITPGVAGGKPRISGRHITVQNMVIWHERMGKSADEIATEYDLSLADIYAALAYYFDHRVEIDSSRHESRVAERIKLYIDEHVPRAVVRGLREWLSNQWAIYFVFISPTATLTAKSSSSCCSASTSRSNVDSR